jgi:hypothetical protein
VEESLTEAMFPEFPVSRRVFLALGASAVVAACSSSEESATDSVANSDSTPNTTPDGTTGNGASTTTTAPAPSTTTPAAPYSQPGWLTAENALAGTDAWRIDIDLAPTKRASMPGIIEGFADTTSARPGQTVSLYVATAAPTWHIEAYRMGFYGGTLGRLIWQSDELEQPWQFEEPSLDRETRMHVSNWTPSMSFTIDDSWPPGSYLLKLVSSEGGAHYVPLTVRRDECSASLVVVSAVTTWQAYNPWGGRSLYENFGDGSRFDRSKVVSFDRPYALAYSWGSADFLTHELPLIALIEELGIDTAYATDIDLHTSGLGENDELDAVFANRTALLTTGHDEYYSRGMRICLERARDAGINLAFFGANAVYRHVRLEPNEDGMPYRQMANYRTMDDDPMSEVDPMEATVQWRNAPLNAPESELIGVQYFAAGITANYRVVNPGNWVFEGTDVRNGQSFRKLVSIEADGLGPPSREPETLEVLASGPVSYRGAVYNHAMTYYSHASGAGVIATGTIAWINALDAEEWADEETTEFVRTSTANILRAFAAGPAGVAHPSTGNASRYRSSVKPVE